MYHTKLRSPTFPLQKIAFCEIWAKFGRNQYKSQGEIFIGELLLYPNVEKGFDKGPNSSPNANMFSAVGPRRDTGKVFVEKTTGGQSGDGALRASAQAGKAPVLPARAGAADKGAPAAARVTIASYSLLSGRRWRDPANALAAD